MELVPWQKWQCCHSSGKNGTKIRSRADFISALNELHIFGTQFRSSSTFLELKSNLVPKNGTKFQKCSSYGTSFLTLLRKKRNKSPFQVPNLKWNYNPLKSWFYQFLERVPHFGTQFRSSSTFLELNSNLVPKNGTKFQNCSSWN